ncbi:hypothetical protein B0T16DRAFT_207317 [Cercophora newfieldiana]|uniref:Uncharacterized protein n=1 Tax=Cercophora newfieldiana TaxID=92897 RepID=A0AA40CL63_9PEZI|nr:hypothetical protein B0T16DRAFT_207317 [Cercophora newfieldiana]
MSRGFTGSTVSTCTMPRVAKSNGLQQTYMFPSVAQPARSRRHIPHPTQPPHLPKLAGGVRSYLHAALIRGQPTISWSKRSVIPIRRVMHNTRISQTWGRPGSPSRAGARGCLRRKEGLIQVGGADASPNPVPIGACKWQCRAPSILGDDLPPWGTLGFPPHHTRHVNHGPWLDCFRRCYDNTPYHWVLNLNERLWPTSLKLSDLRSPLFAAQVWPRRSSRTFFVLGACQWPDPSFFVSACLRSDASRLAATRRQRQRPRPRCTASPFLHFPTC